MLPPEVAAALPASIDRAAISSFARLHAAIDSPLGESHLVAAGRLLFAVTRRSPFDPFVAVALRPGGASYEESAFSRKLTLVTVEGATHVMDVSILDVDAIKGFMTAIGHAGPVVPADVPARVEAARAPQRVEDRSPERARLVSVMKSRVAQVRAEPFPGHERYIAPTAALPRIKPKVVTPSPEPSAPSPPRKKKKNRPRAEEHTPEPTPPDGPLFRTGHWIALLVIAPLIFLAFVILARAMR